MAANVAVVGATGAVGQTMREVLEERDFPVGRIKFLASGRSAGSEVAFRGKAYTVEELGEGSFEDVDIALFSIPKDLSRKFSPIAARSGAVVVDNSNAFRMDPEVPLVVPEVNAHAIADHKGIIANPNCSTIQMVVALKPIYDAAGITRIVVTTMQAVSGTGREAIEELERLSRAALDGTQVKPEVYPFQIAFNCLPEIPNRKPFGPGGYTEEEIKMVNETRRILGDSSIQLTATCVRVPVFIGHSETVNIETKTKLTAEDARALLAKAPGVRVVDDPAGGVYPTALDAAGNDQTLVGRIREDLSVECGLNLWVVSDNLRKGAATNAVQIAEYLL
ncbi:MAG: aspartate-semialdehyde dehydrogenase [Planctomycetes bacterium]|nr:aspartate-semialdehyde dehydrogenase [Planctomycetota bacterium]